MSGKGTRRPGAELLNSEKKCENQKEVIKGVPTIAAMMGHKKKSGNAVTNQSCVSST